MTTETDTLCRLERVVLESESNACLPPYMEVDRAEAIEDLTRSNHFAPVGAMSRRGPFVLRLTIRDGRLIFDIRDRADTPLIAIGLVLGPFRRLMKDYQLLVDSHALAVEEGREARIQAIDMGRRGLHNEGAELMKRRLNGKISIDFDTARRLFTLVCVLHQRISAR